MPDFHTSDGVRLHYFVWGEAGERPPVFLHHGFAASMRSSATRESLATRPDTLMRLGVSPATSDSSVQAR